MPCDIRVVNKHHGVPYDIYIGRGSKWGNPFTHMPNTKGLNIANSREESLEMFRLWILTQQQLVDSLHELDGKTLGCTCDPLPCHGHILKELREHQLDR